MRGRRRRARHVDRKRLPSTRTCYLKASKTAGWQKFVNDSQLDASSVQSAELKPFFAKFEKSCARY